MKKFSAKAKAKLGVIGAVVLTGATSAMADGGVTLPANVATADIMSWAGIILVGIAAIWPIKKLIALGNKS